MKKSLFFMLLTAIICSCNPIPNKPFYEELTLDELAKAIKADEEFAEWYEELMDSRLITRTTDVEKAKYKDVTHRRLFKYSKHMNDFKYWIRFDSISNLKWEEEYASTIKSVDSLVAVKKELKEQAFAKVNELASFELVDISHKWERRRVWDLQYDGSFEKVEKRVDYLELTFKCIFSVPEVSRIEAELYCWGKEGYPRLEKVSDLYGTNLKNGEDWKRTYNYELDFFKSYTKERFLKECDYEFRINKIIIGTDTIEVDYSDEFGLVEYEVSRYGTTWLKLAKSNFNPNIKSKYTYTEELKEKDLQEFDSLVYQMLDELL